MTNFFKFTLAAFAFVMSACTGEIYHDGGGDDEAVEQPLFEVVEYTPAPGQFINEGYTATTMAEACEYADGRLSKGYLLSLGGFGGYIVVKFHTPILNSEGDYDFGIYGNPFGSSSEPGIVYVSMDSNENGVADDEWYELYGSEGGKGSTTPNYSITYSRTDDERRIAWRDNCGGSGTIERNAAHTQDYFPRWITTNDYTLSGRLLPNNAEWREMNQEWVLHPFEWGYVDNFSAVDLSDDRANRFRILDARDATGEAVVVTHIDFVKVQSASNAVYSTIGEVSTELRGFVIYENGVE